MKDNTIQKLDEVLDKYEVIETGHLYHHEHDKDKLKSDIVSILEEAMNRTTNTTKELA